MSAWQIASIFFGIITSGTAIIDQYIVSVLLVVDIDQAVLLLLMVTPIEPEY
jgi:hypothetical protein